MVDQTKFLFLFDVSSIWLKISVSKAMSVHSVQISVMDHLLRSRQFRQNLQPKNWE